MGLFALKPHQSVAMAMLRDSIRRGNKRIVIQIPTGGGKTVLGCHVSHGAMTKHNRVAFTAPALSLIDQTFERMHQNGIDLGDMGVMQGDHPWHRPHAPLQIVSVMTGASRGFPDVQVALVDECHIQFQAVNDWMDAHPEMIFIGLSATPWARGMAERWQDLVIPTSMRELIASGDLCQFKVYAPTKVDLSDVKIVAGDYHEGQLSAKMRNRQIMVDVVQNWLDNAERRPTLVFAVDRAHAGELERQFSGVGVRTAYVDMNTSRDDREQIGKDFHAGKVEAVVSVGTMIAGVDWDVRCIVNACPTKSEIRWVQLFGRGMRTAPGKDYLLVFDHTNTASELGLPTEIEEMHRELLPGRKKGERIEREVERKPKTPTECPQCKFLIPVGQRQCECGFTPVRPSNIICDTDAEMVAYGTKTQRKHNRETSKIDKAQFFAELKGFAQEQGKSDGWVAHQYRERFGVWPNDPFIRNAPPVRAGMEVRSYIRSRQIAWAKSKRKEKQSMEEDSRRLADA